MMFSKLFVSVAIFSGCVYTYSPVFFSNPNTWDDVTKNPTNPGSSIIHMKEWKNISERKMCGESLQHVAGLVVDKTDKEAKVIVEGSIRTNKLILKLGCIKEKEIYIKNIILPIETISSKCINIREKIQDSTILCLENKFMRNFWNNSITDAVLCHETKVRGKLPQYNYSEDTKTEDEEELNTVTTNEETKEVTSEDTKDIANEETKDIISEETKDITSEETKDITNEETKDITDEETKEVMNEINNQESEEITNDEDNKSEPMEETNNEEETKTNDEWKQNILKEEFEDEIEKNEEQKGLKLRIAKSKYGYPKVKINGTNIQEFKKNNKTGELRSTNAEDNVNEINVENEVSEETENSINE